MMIDTSWDDGAKLDLKIAKLLLKYQLPGTFYIPNVCELDIDEIILLDNLGFEIGGHTVSHPSDMKLLSDFEAFDEINDNKQWLEGIIRCQINSFCYPKGKYNENTISAVKKCQFKEARTTMVLNTEQPKNLYRIYPTVHVYPNRVEYNGKHWLDIAKEQFDIAMNKNGYFHLWGHSWEVEKFKEWDNLEKFFEYVKQNTNNTGTLR